MKPFEKLRRYWLESNSQINTVALSEEAVCGLEAKYDTRLPEDFRDYLLHVCPADDTACDVNLTDWWRFDRMKSIPEEYQSAIGNDVIARDGARYLFFADFAIWCWAWAINCGDDENRGRVAVIGSPDRYVAGSFAEFVDRYIGDLKSLHPHG
jgi:hypothetical protein